MKTMRDTESYSGSVQERLAVGKWNVADWLSLGE